MADQLTSDELRQVLAEWLRPMRPKHRQKILGLAGLFEAVIARAEAAEAEVVDLHRQLAEMAAAMEEIEDERLALLARVAELEAALGGLDALASDYDLPDGEAVAMAISDGRILTAGRRNIHGAVMGVMDVNRDNEALRARAAELESQLAAQQWRPVTEDWPPYNERVIIGHGGGYDGGWFAFARRVRADNRNEDDWLMDDDTTLAFESAVVAMRRPLPPAPQERTP